MDQSKLKPIQCWKLHNIQIMDYSEVRSFFVPVKICSSLVDSPDLCVPMENDKPLTLKLYSPITAYKKYGTVPFMSVWIVARVSTKCLEWSNWTIRTPKKLSVTLQCTKEENEHCQNDKDSFLLWHPYTISAGLYTPFVKFWTTNSDHNQPCQPWLMVSFLWQTFEYFLRTRPRFHILMHKGDIRLYSNTSDLTGKCFFIIFPLLSIFIIFFIPQFGLFRQKEFSAMPLILLWTKCETL